MSEGSRCCGLYPYHQHQSQWRPCQYRLCSKDYLHVKMSLRPSDSNAGGPLSGVFYTDSCLIPLTSARHTSAWWAVCKSVTSSENICIRPFPTFVGFVQSHRAQCTQLRENTERNIKKRMHKLLEELSCHGETARRCVLLRNVVMHKSYKKLPNYWFYVYIYITLNDLEHYIENLYSPHNSDKSLEF